MSPQQVPCSSSERQITRFKHQKLLSPSCLAKSAAPSLQVMRVMFSSLFGNERIKEVRAQHLINQFHLHFIRHLCSTQRLSLKDAANKHLLPVTTRKYVP